MADQSAGGKPRSEAAGRRFLVGLEFERQPVDQNQVAGFKQKQKEAEQAVEEESGIEPGRDAAGEFEDGQHQGREERRVGGPKILKRLIAHGRQLAPGVVELVVGVVGDEPADAQRQ